MSHLPDLLRDDVHTACEHPAEPCAICRHTLEAADYIEQLEAAIADATTLLPPERWHLLLPATTAALGEVQS